MPELTSTPDQTTKQPVVWCCANPTCRPVIGCFEFESDYPTCPKCGASGEPQVFKRTLIHLLLADERGPILGNGRRYRMACDEKRARAYLATLTNGEAAVNLDHAELANCPGCLSAVGKQPKLLLGG